MNPERWHKVEAIFQAALDLELKERNEFLDSECDGDRELRAEVEKLIKNLEGAESFIESPIWNHTRTERQPDNPMSDTFADLLSIDDGSMLIGKKIGVFKIIEEIGRGGMGTVFLAERADGEFNQKVAVKLIRRGMDSDFIIRRFRHERQILASFDHPYISRLLDGGRTPEGLPYFVMEYVEGDSLYDYCDRKTIDIKGRLKIFRQICSAVSYAHDKQIIHRDIKPGNILVTGDGIPKLLDFGIAKIRDPSLIHESESPTSSFVRMMTPDYASPEQMTGKQITTASDIYSLGVLLYELCTGHRPHDFSSLPLHEISRIVSDVLPKLPSRVIESEKNLLSKYDSDPGNFVRACNTNGVELTRAMTGDLDNIIMKSLAKDPAARYQNADELSCDLERFLRHEPANAEDFVRHRDALFPLKKNDNSSGMSLAVLPFKYLNLAGPSDTNEDFLGIGLADALITRLSRIRRFTVRPSSSFLSLGEAETDPIKAGNALEADYVLDGSIKQINDRLRVTVQLLDVERNSAVWAATIDETISDIFALEDTIATRVVEGLLPQITGVELEDFSKRGTENAEAFEHCLRGRYFFNSGTEEGLAKAFVCFHEAVTADPDYAHAYVGLADYYDFLGIYGVLPPKECFTAAIEAATKAVELDEHSEQAHASLGFSVHAGNYDWSKADYHLGRALELNPNYAVAYVWFAIIRYTQGRFSEGLDFAARALELDPLTPFNHHNVGWGLFFARRFEESVEQYRRVIEHFPKYGLGYYGLSKSLRYIGQTEESLSQIRFSKTVFGESVFVLTSEAESLAASGDAAGTKKLLKKLDKLAETRYVSPYQLSLIYCYLGDRENTLHYLEEAFEIKEAWLNWLGVEPAFDLVREDPRFQAILEKTGYQFFFNDPTVHDGRSTTINGNRRPNTSETILFGNEQEISAGSGAFVTRPDFSWKKPGVYVPTFLLLFSVLAGFLFYGTGGKQPANSAQSVVLNANSIVILPFTSKDSADENLGIGLADALSGRLGYLKRLSVIAPNSGRIIAKENPEKYPADFPARFVVRGQISRPSEKNVSINAELLDSVAGTKLWNETFSSEDEDFFSIQTKIAERVWTTLNIPPLPKERLQISKVYTKSNSAYELYLIGRFLMSTRSPENLRKAIALFTQSAQEDSNFALAYAGLADAYALLNLYEMRPPADAFQKAKENAHRALELDDNLAEAHTSLAYIKFYEEKDRQGAELGFRRAIQINPSYSQAHHWFAIVLMAMNRPMDAIEEMRTAEQLDPRSLIVRTALGMMFVYDRRYDAALRECEEVLRTDSGFVPALKVRRWIFQLKGDYKAAHDAFRKERSYSGGDAKHPGWYVIEAQIEAMNQNKKEVAARLERAVADKQVRDFPGYYSYEIALAYNALGEDQKAVAWLRKGIQAADNSVNMVGVDPRFENMRKDPRFLSIQNAMNARPVRE